MVGCKTGYGTFRGHLSVRTVSQQDLGILHLKRGMCGPDPAVPQAKTQIKSSSAPCLGQSWRGSARAPRCSEGAKRLFKGWFCTRILLPSTDRERHSMVQPRTSGWPRTSKQSTAREPRPPAWPWAPHHAQGEGESAGSDAGVGDSPLREHVPPRCVEQGRGRSTFPCSAA